MLDNGNPGFFIVYKTAEGDRGRTTLSILTDEKLIKIHVGIPLTEDDYLLAEFMEFAGLVH